MPHIPTPDDAIVPSTLLPAEPAGWPEIDGSLLEDARGAVPPFPLGLLPAGWADWIGDCAQATGAPPDYVAQGLLAAVAALCGAGVQIRPTPAWSEPLVLWQALVGPPSSGKSPALAVVRRLLGAIEVDRRAGDAARRSRHEAALEQARLLTAGWQQACADAITAGRTPPDKPAAATFDAEFLPTQLVVADATVEALADVVAANPHGVVLWRDELSAWLANLGRYANGGTDRAHWLEAWAAAGVTINRRSRNQPLHLPRFPVSIVGTIQPDRLADALEGSDDGMAARFLYAWPDAPSYISLRQRRAARDDAALGRLQRIARLAGGAAAPFVLPFHAQAMELLDDFLARLHERTREADGLEAGWLGKGPGTVARLAGALTLLAWSDTGDPNPPGQVGGRAVQGACALWGDYFRRHAASVFNHAGRSDRDRNARRVVRWLRATGAPELSREQVRREALSFAVDAEGADRTIARLEAGGILRPAPALTTGRGRPARRWMVNSAIR